MPKKREAIDGITAVATIIADSMQWDETPWEYVVKVNDSDEGWTLSTPGAEVGWRVITENVHLDESSLRKAYEMARAWTDDADADARRMQELGKG